MFRRFASKIPNDAEHLFKEHPLVLAALMELAWENRFWNDMQVGSPHNRSALGKYPFLQNLLSFCNNAKLPPLNYNYKLPTLDQDYQKLINDTTFFHKDQSLVLWDHLIYAYMIENTRIY